MLCSKEHRRIPDRGMVQGKTATGQSPMTDNMMIKDREAAVAGTNTILADKNTEAGAVATIINSMMAVGENIVIRAGKMTNVIMREVADGVVVAAEAGVELEVTETGHIADQGHSIQQNRKKRPATTYLQTSSKASVLSPSRCTNLTNKERTTQDNKFV